MQSTKTVRGRQIIGPDGNAVSFADLPPAGSSGRWVPRKKAVVVAAVRGGLISLEDACERYALSIDEYVSWQSAVERHGLRGLRTTKVQNYRSS